MKGRPCQALGEIQTSRLVCLEGTRIGADLSLSPPPALPPTFSFKSRLRLGVATWLLPKNRLLHPKPAVPTRPRCVKRETTRICLGNALPAVENSDCSGGFVSSGAPPCLIGHACRAGDGHMQARGGPCLKPLKGGVFLPGGLFHGLVVGMPADCS